MDDRFWNIVIKLGVPGLALGVFFALYNKFGFDFAPVPKEWSGPIAILFLLLVAGVVIVALIRYQHGTPRSDHQLEPVVPKGQRRMKVQIVAPDGIRTIERADLFIDCPWPRAAAGFAVGFDLPQEASLYQLLDVKGGKWLPTPRTIRDLKLKSGTVTLVHAEMANKYGNKASDIAAAVNLVNEAHRMRRSPTS